MRGIEAMREEEERHGGEAGIDPDNLASTPQDTKTLAEEARAIAERNNDIVKGLADYLAAEGFDMSGLTLQDEEEEGLVFFEYYDKDGIPVTVEGLTKEEAQAKRDAAYIAGGSVEVSYYSINDSKEQVFTAKPLSQGVQADIFKNLAQLTPISEHRIHKPMTKVSSNLKEAARAEEGLGLKVSSQKERQTLKGRDLLTYLNVTDKDGGGIVLKGFTEIIQDAIGALYHHAVKQGHEAVFSTSQIWREVSQKEKTARPSQEMIDHINATILKAGNTFVTIEYEQEITRDPDAKPIKAYAKERRRLINANPITITVDGAGTAEGWRVLEAPPVFEHADEVNQFADLDPEPLRIKGLRNDPDNIVLKNYIYKQVIVAQRKGLNRLELTYAKLWEQLDNPNVTKNKGTAKRKVVAKVLDSFRDKDGLITSWKEENRPGTRTKYKVIIALK